MSLGSLILTGGASMRMGEDKATADWLGKRAVDRVFDLAREVAAQTVLTVGRRILGLPAVTDEEEGGGPVGGIIAGCVALQAAGCERALVLAVDAPTIVPADVEPLLLARHPGAAFAHLHLPFLIYLDAVPASVAAGASVARLLTDAHLRLVEPPPKSYIRLRGANTPDEREALLSELRNRA